MAILKSFRFLVATSKFPSQIEQDGSPKFATRVKKNVLSRIFVEKRIFCMYIRVHGDMRDLSANICKLQNIMKRIYKSVHDKPPVF